ncbi:hypothetical protein ACFL0L_02290 [Patescibacteria group bacterium]
MKKLLIIVIILIVLAIIAAAIMYFVTPPELQDETTIGFKIRSQTWSGTITVKQKVTFAPWAILTIEPGTTVLFDVGEDSACTDATDCECSEYLAEYTESCTCLDGGCALVVE